MAIKHPTEDEFEVRENTVIHKPTNARWTAYPGVAEAHLYTPSRLGSVLPNGDDYREHEVGAIARKLMLERLGR